MLVVGNAGLDENQGSRFVTHNFNSVDETDRRFSGFHFGEVHPRGICSNNSTNCEQSYSDPYIIGIVNRNSHFLTI